MRFPEIDSVVHLCPAKLNLRLAVVGRREDGYHELRSIVVPISLFDRLEVKWVAEAGPDQLEITGSDLAVDESNLVLRAARAFRGKFPFPGSLRIRLEKEIPIGAGLGGGSSDAAGMLLALQTLWDYPLEGGELEEMAVGLGADVSFFLRPEAAVMRGLGEDLTVAPHLAEQLTDRTFLVFKPSLGISTVWAYDALANAEAYQREDEEETLLAAFESGTRKPREWPFNAFRSVVDERYPTIPVLLEDLRSVPGVAAEMSGSGSACFAFFRDPELISTVCGKIQQAWGKDAFVREVRVV